MASAWISHSADQASATLEEIDETSLNEAEVLIKVQYSCLNYKDALALTHSAPIARVYPMVHGIDAVGKVVKSSSPDWPEGMVCQVNDWGLGETHWGGLSTLVGVPAAWVTGIPEGRSACWAASLGTAGYTAALSVMALLDHGLKVSDGPVLVTGVTGGVGSIATLLLDQMGFEVIGSTGSIDAMGEPVNENVERHFQALGLDSHHLIHRESLSRPGKPLQKPQFAAVVDSIGSHTLANACAQTQYGGIVTACGLAQGMDFDASVAPFILRGVTLRGINCVFRTQADRNRAWALLAEAFSEGQLDWMYRVVPLQDAHTAAQRLLSNEIQGRVVVNCA